MTDMTDTERLDWLAKDPARNLQDLLGWLRARMRDGEDADAAIRRGIDDMRGADNAFWAERARELEEAREVARRVLDAHVVADDDEDDGA